MNPNSDNQSSAIQKTNSALFRPLDQAFIRTPVLPVETLGANADKTTVARNPLMHEALFVASMSLTESFLRLSLSPKKARQLQSSLLRYIIRMSSRTTPFGLFSGVAQVPIGDRTDLPLVLAAKQRHRTRLDMEWLLSYIMVLEQDPKIQPSLIYTYQPIMTKIGNRYYFEHRNEAGKVTNTSVIATSGVDKLIEKTRSGKAYADLRHEMLADIPEATPNEMAAFLDKFVRYGVICSSLRPPLTCADPARYVASQLATIPKAEIIARSLTKLLGHISQYDACPPGRGEAVLRSIIEEVKQLHPLPNDHVPFDVDLAIGFSRKPQLQRSLAEDAARLAELLLRLSMRNPTETMLSSYRQAFVDRYGYNQLVPVLTVINRDIGLGLPDHYATAHRHNKHANTSTTKQTDRDKILMKLALKALRNKELSLNLDDTIVMQLTPPDFGKATLPESLDIAAQIAASSEIQLNRGEYLFVASPLTGAQAAGRTAGRFADLLGEPSIAYLQAITDKQSEQAADILHAELVYLPHSGHAANVAIRPSLREYEIVVGTTPSVLSDHVLPLDDLFLGVQGNRLYVWSAAHQKEVIVQGGHMLNTVNAPSICRFLIDVSADNRYLLTQFSWGAASQLPMLPRVTHGRLVLSLAEWNLHVEDILEDSARDKQRKDTLATTVWYPAIQRWRTTWQVPRFVYLAEGDNRLLLDLEREDHVAELFLSASAHGTFRSLHIVEALPGPEHAWIANKDGHFLNECIFQVIRSEPRKDDVSDKTKRAPVYQSIASTERLRLPGSDWLYCKLYMPITQQNESLALYVEQLVRAVIGRQAVDSWFFIRYSDPIPHIRLRFKTSEVNVTSTLLPVVLAWARQMQAAGLLQNFIIDAYDREIERYGGIDAIPLAEAIFAGESEADLQLVMLSERDGLGDLTLPDIAVLTASILLGAFGLDDSQQIAWAKAQHIGHTDSAKDYRHDRQRILSLMHAYREGSLTPEGLLTICRQLETELAPIGRAYRELEESGKLIVPIDQILSSLMHMHCNRLLGTDRQQEHRVLTYVWRILSDMPKWQQGTKKI